MGMHSEGNSVRAWWSCDTAWKASNPPIKNKASNRYTVIEVNARDRPGLLARLAYAIHASGHAVHSAHIATYGERAVDTFYLTNADGRKLSISQISELRAALAAAASPAERSSRAA